MRQVFEAFKEWLRLRARLREERRFHIEPATAGGRAAFGRCRPLDSFHISTIIEI